MSEGENTMTKKNVLIIGAGGVGHVAAHKAAMQNDVLGDICIASRTLSKCEAIIDSVQRKGHLQSSRGNWSGVQSRMRSRMTTKARNTCSSNAR